MTQREQFRIARFKADAYKYYIELCINLKEVPKEEILVLIDGCSNVKALEKCIEMFKTRKL